MIEILNPDDLSAASRYGWLRGWAAIARAR